MGLRLDFTVEKPISIDARDLAHLDVCNIEKKKSESAWRSEQGFRYHIESHEDNKICEKIVIHIDDTIENNQRYLCMISG